MTSNKTFWPLNNAFDASFPSLSTDITTDILIVGGGITGALMAFKLIEEGKNVVLIDKRDVCAGSTSASTAMLQYEIDMPLHQLIALRGLTCAVSSYKACEQTIFELQKIIKRIKSDCHFELRRSIYFTTTEKDIDFLRKEFDTRKEHGFKVKWLEKTELETFGLNALAAIDSESGAVMDPYRLAIDLLKYCKRKKMQIFDRTEIKKTSQKKDYLMAYTDGGYRIKTNDIIYCTGYESVNLIREKIVNLKSTYAIISEAFDETPYAFKNHIYWDTSTPYLYFRSTDDGRIIVGGGDEGFKNPQKRDALLPKKAKYLIAEFSKCFPNISLKLDYSWAGTFGETKDGLPYFGKPTIEKNEHYILGFGGNGITFSVLGMDVILDTINQAPNHFLDYYKFGR